MATLNALKARSRAFVYILQHAYKERIKIGRSVNPYSRARSLPDLIDYGRSFQLSVDPLWVGRVEKTLQFVLREFAVTVEHKGDGATEWFDARAVPVAVAFIERNPDMFPNGGFVVLDQPRAQQFPRAANSAGCAARKATERADWRRSCERDSRAMVWALTDFVSVLEGCLFCYRNEDGALIVAGICDNVDSSLVRRVFETRLWIGDPDDSDLSQHAVSLAGGWYRSEQLVWFRVPRELDPWRETSGENPAVKACRTIVGEIPIVYPRRA